jgi:phage-related minor tail protein
MSNTLFSADINYDPSREAAEMALHMAHLAYFSDRLTEASQHLMTALVYRLMLYGGAAQKTKEVVAVLEKWYEEYATPGSQVAEMLENVRNYVNSVPEKPKKFYRPGEEQLCSGS